MRTKLFLSIALLVVALHPIAATPIPRVKFLASTSPGAVPPQALIGEDFTFTVTFDNQTTGSTVGYAPFIDLVFDAGGANMTKPPSCACDGITFVSAKVIGVNGGPVSLATFPVSANCNPTPTTVSLSHPFASNGVLPVIVPAGGQLVTIQLPFGSYNNSQPKIAVEVTAHVSNYADEGVSLTIWARGGFQYGADALNNPTSDPPVLSNTNPNSSTWSTHAPTTPRVMIIKKECSAPEDETATGPNYPRTYTIKVDIADGQSIGNLYIQDILPNNVQYVGNVAVTTPWGNANPGGTCKATGVDYVLTPPSTSVPGGTLDVLFCKPIVGSPNPPHDVTITFTFYIPEKDAHGNLVLPNCTPVLSINKIHAEGDWTPLDPCDTSPPPPVHVTSTVNVAHKLHDKCIAVQKKVTLFTDLNATGPTPGDTLKYVIDFQVSDYKTIDKIKITDYLSDGQAVVNIPAPPTLTTISDQFPNSPYTNVVSLLTVTVDPNTRCPPVLGGVQGGKRLVFDVSGALMAAAGSIGHPRHKLGILTGGWAASSSSTTPATGQIVFYAQIQNQFSLQHPPGDNFVDKDDPLNDCVRYLSGRICTNKPVPLIPPGSSVFAQDDSMTATAIVTDTIKKTVYAVRRGKKSFVCGPSPSTACSNFPNPPQEVHPGDEVTFRIEKTIPSSDAEYLTIQDFLPKPVFDVNDPDAIGGPGPSWNGPLITPCAAPPPMPGVACRFTPASGPGGTDTLFSPPLLTGFPRLVVGPQQIAANSIKFDYSTFNDPNNHPRKIDQLFTNTVTYQPYADGLFLTNEAQECENNTFGVTFCQTAVAQVNLREPNLRIRKGVIATDNPNGQFSPPGPPPTSNLATAQPPSGVTFNLSGFSGGPITSAAQIDSNLSNVDANDKVTFAIVIENQGGHPAYDVQLTDTIPSCLTNVTAITVKDGTGAFLPPGSFTINPTTPTTNFTFSLNTPIPAYATNGTNIIVITFQAQLLSNITPGCCDNVAKLTHYASQHTGPDFVVAGFSPPFQDSATVCVKPTADKCVKTTSEVSTNADSSFTGSPQPPQVAIGEIVRYRLKVTLPEGVSPFFTLVDHLPPGLTYMNDGTTKVAFISNTPILHPSLSGAGLDINGMKATCLAPQPTFVLPANKITPGTFTSGTDPTFSLGTLTNNDNDSNLEYVIVDFNALVNNLPPNATTPGPPNQSGALLSNYYDIYVGKLIGNSTPIATSPTTDIKIVEPKLDVQKTYTPSNPIPPVTPAYFTVTLTNTGTTDAFDVHLTDSIPSGLTLSTFPVPTVTVSPAGCATPSTPVVSGSTITVDVPKIPASPGCTITLKFWVQGQFCGTNTAQVSYSSLPGGINSYPSAPVGTQPNSTGSITPCLLSNQEDCERIYTASGQASNNVACCAPQPPEMLSWWRLDETSGNTVVDYKNGHNGTTSGNIGSDPTVTSPKVASALFFTNANASVPGGFYNFGTGNFSIDAWVKGAAHPTTSLGIVYKLDAAASPKGFAFFVGASNNCLELTMGNGTSSPATFISNPTFSYGPWQHVAVTVQRTSGSPTITFYINGAQAGTFTPPATSVNNSIPLLIGSYRPNGTGCQSCEVALDEIEIFDGVVSLGDIKAIYDAGSAGKCP